MLLTQMWNEEAREARGLRRMSVTVSSQLMSAKAEIGITRDCPDVKVMMQKR